MEQELEDKLRVVAEYDEWNFESEEWDMMYKVSDSFWYKETEEDTIHADKVEEFKYHEDIGWLWPVAKKVCADLISTGVTNREIYSGLYLSITGALCDFDLPALFTATYNAILFINKNKEK